MSSLEIKDIEIGQGPEAQAGQRLTMHYKGTLENGKKFDSSYDRGTPFQFTLGVGQVIQGWDQGVVGMRVGGKRQLIIPSELGYGARGIGSIIPPHNTLIFDIELVAID